MCFSTLFGADWPGWRGPDRTGVSREVGLLKEWPKEGPKLVWQSDKAGQGYAGIAIVGGVVYTMGARGEDEYLIALDEAGKEKWATKIGPVLDWDANSWSRGPNSTPTVEGELVYGLSSTGVLLAASKASGKPVWRIDLPKELGGEVNDVGGGYEGLGWGYSWSPLVDGDNLILLAGGSKGLFAAVDKKSGKVLWRSKEVAEPATYSSPVMATLGGVKQYLALTQNKLVSVSARDGSLLWKHEHGKDYNDVVCPTPVVKDNLVYITVGYNEETELLKITGSGGKFEVAKIYSEKVIGSKQGGVVLLDKHIYGYHEDKVWVCQEFETGKMVWPKTIRARQPLKAGGVLAAEGKLYVLDETGTVGMIEASPAGFKVLGQVKLPMESKLRKSRGGIWTHPSLSDGKLYVRDQELIFCYQVK